MDQQRRRTVAGGEQFFAELEGGDRSVRGSIWSRFVWNLVTLGIVIPLGLIFARTTKIFRYLRRSVSEFDSVKTLEDRLRNAGFADVRTETMDGWQRGIVHSFLASRPS